MSNGDLPARASPANYMVLTMSLGGPAMSLGGPAWFRAGRRHEKGRGRRGSVAGWKSENLTKSEKFKHKSEKFACSRRRSEKFKPKVRNSRVCAGKVRNSNQK